MQDITGESNMELTDKIKEEIKKAKSEEEVKTILENVKGVEDAGVILDDADLDRVAGGYAVNIPKSFK